MMTYLRASTKRVCSCCRPVTLSQIYMSRNFKHHTKLLQISILLIILLWNGPFHGKDEISKFVALSPAEALSFTSGLKVQNERNSLFQRRNKSQQSMTHLRKSSGLFGQKKSVLFSQRAALLPIPKLLLSPSQTSTALNMVLTTPESIIEQASTIKLLDDLIDESVRTSARKPIMMQFQPTPYWVSATSNIS